MSDSIIVAISVRNSIIKIGRYHGRLVVLITIPIYEIFHWRIYSWTDHLHGILGQKEMYYQQENTSEMNGSIRITSQCTAGIIDFQICLYATQKYMTIPS